MGIAYNPSIPNISNCYFYLDMKNPKTVIDQNNLKPVIDNDGVGNFSRVYTSGTTTIESTTVERTSLAYVDTTEGAIIYNTLVPAGDIAPYYSHGGNRYASGKNKVWGFDNFTWAVWHYPLTFNQRGYSPALIDWKHGSGWNSEFGINSSGTPFTNYRITVSPNSSTGITSDGGNAVLNQWNFTLVRRQGGVAKFFQNGVFSSDFSFNVNYEVAAGIGIGWGADKDAQWGNYKGKIGAVITYSVALTNEEIIQLYNTHRGRYGI